MNILSANYIIELAIWRSTLCHIICWHFLNVLSVNPDSVEFDWLRSASKQEWLLRLRNGPPQNRLTSTALIMSQITENASSNK